MKNIPQLKRKIKLIASLTCGQLQNRFCTEFLALESGITVEKLSRIDFRRKFKGNIASNYFQVATDKEGKEGIHLPNQKLPFHIWYYQYFKENACNFCEDVFGEVADVTFMDAWLPEYVNNYRGTSLIIARTSLVQRLLKNSEEIYLNEITIKKVIESQIGVIQKKRVLLRGKLYKKEKSHDWYPKKRLNPDFNTYKKNKQFIDLTDEIQSLSKELWLKHRLDKSTKGFWEDLRDMEFQINRYERKLKLKYLIKLPGNLFKRFLEVLKNAKR